MSYCLNLMGDDPALSGSWISVQRNSRLLKHFIRAAFTFAGPRTRYPASCTPKEADDCEREKNLNSDLGCLSWLFVLNKENKVLWHYPLNYWRTL